MSRHASNDDSNNSKKVFFAIIGVILLGTVFWYGLTLWAAEPIGPETAKEFAEKFERECVLDARGQEECKELTGRNHRECITTTTERVEEGTGDGGGDIEHDRDAYMECMREATGVE